MIGLKFIKWTIVYNDQQAIWNHTIISKLFVNWIIFFYQIRVFLKKWNAMSQIVLSCHTSCTTFLLSCQNQHQLKYLSTLVLEMAAHPWFDVTVMMGSAKRDSQLLGCALFWHLRHQPPPCSPVCKTTLLLAPSDLISPVYIAREATRGLLAANMKVLSHFCVFVPLLALATAGRAFYSLLSSVWIWDEVYLWSRQESTISRLVVWKVLVGKRLDSKSGWNWKLEAC